VWPHLVVIYRKYEISLINFPLVTKSVTLGFEVIRAVQVDDGTRTVGSRYVYTRQRRGGGHKNYSLRWVACTQGPEGM
jgi:hypothetical protein